VPYFYTMHRVLVVDDSELSVKALRRTLEAAGYAVESEHRGTGAAEAVRRHHPDLVLLDIVMPDRTGLEALGDIKADPELATTPVIMVTSRTEAEDVRAALDGGAFDYVRKPFEELEILARVRSAIRVGEYEERLRFLSSHDGLTGLCNHMEILSRLARMLAEAARVRRPLSVLMVDIDHFKLVNDRRGHQFGDVVLRRMGEILDAHFNALGAAGRYGGEEFCVALRNLDGDMAVRSADAFRKLVAGLDWPGHEGFALTVSVGVAVYEGGLETADTILAQADAALYRAKDGGRDRVSR